MRSRSSRAAGPPGPPSIGPWGVIQAKYSPAATASGRPQRSIIPTAAAPTGSSCPEGVGVAQGPLPTPRGAPPPAAPTAHPTPPTPSLSPFPAPAHPQPPSWTTLPRLGTLTVAPPSAWGGDPAPQAHPAELQPPPTPGCRVGAKSGEAPTAGWGCSLRTQRPPDSSMAPCAHQGKWQAPGTPGFLEFPCNAALGRRF